MLSVLLSLLIILAKITHHVDRRRWPRMLNERSTNVLNASITPVDCTVVGPSAGVQIRPEVTVELKAMMDMLVNYVE